MGIGWRTLGVLAVTALAAGSCSDTAADKTANVEQQFVFDLKQPAGTTRHGDVFRTGSKENPEQEALLTITGDPVAVVADLMRQLTDAGYAVESTEPQKPPCVIYPVEDASGAYLTIDSQLPDGPKTLECQVDGVKKSGKGAQAIYILVQVSTGTPERQTSFLYLSGHDVEKWRLDEDQGSDPIPTGKSPIQPPETIPLPEKIEGPLVQDDLVPRFGQPELPAGWTLTALVPNPTCPDDGYLATAESPSGTAEDFESRLRAIAGDQELDEESTVTAGNKKYTYFDYDGESATLATITEPGKPTYVMFGELTCD